MKVHAGKILVLLGTNTQVIPFGNVQIISGLIGEKLLGMTFNSEKKFE